MVWTKQVAGVSPYPIGVGITEPKPNADTVKRGDMMIPEIQYTTEKARTPQGFATEISDQVPETKERSEYPMAF
jgi:hypothetical protein